VKLGNLTVKNLLMVLVLLSVASNTWAEPFFARLALQGVTFQVESPNEGSINLVTVRTETPDGELDQIGVEADGTVTNAEVDDLNDDGYPEIYVYVNSAGSGSYGSLVAYATNKNGSLSRIDLPPLETESEAAQGYMGHDQFAVDKGSLLRRFPLYREGDTNSAPSGGTRQVQYQLEAVKGRWRLVPYMVMDF